MINYVFKTKNSGSFLKLLKNINLVLFFIHANLSSSKRVADRVADLRSYLMTEQKEKKKDVNVSKNMETIINLFKQELEKDIDLKITLDKSIQVNAFPIMLHQLWSNLLKNAIEALKQKNGPKTLDIKLYSADGFAIIEFTNNGPQIENKALDKIFENLYTTKEKAAGLGLGIVKNVVDAHRAKIKVSSSIEETCFKIHLKNN
jgi:Signal transduction histidine kinase